MWPYIVLDDAPAPETNDSPAAYAVRYPTHWLRKTLWTAHRSATFLVTVLRRMDMDAAHAKARHAAWKALRSNQRICHKAAKALELQRTVPRQELEALARPL